MQHAAKKKCITHLCSKGSSGRGRQEIDERETAVITLIATEMDDSGLRVVDSPAAMCA